MPEEDPQVATKAPESDAQEHEDGPAILEDTPAQTGPAMCESCTTDRPTRKALEEMVARSQPNVLI